MLGLENVDCCAFVLPVKLSAAVGIAVNCRPLAEAVSGAAFFWASALFNPVKKNSIPKAQRSIVAFEKERDKDTIILIRLICLMEY
jgi:hypothetical protein